GVARAVLLTGEPHPLPKDGQGQHLTAAQRGRGTGVRLGLQLGLAAGVDQDGDWGQEGVHRHRELRSWQRRENTLVWRWTPSLSRDTTCPRLTHAKRFSPGHGPVGEYRVTGL